jgi:uncharacterized membrane protein
LLGVTAIALPLIKAPYILLSLLVLAVPAIHGAGRLQRWGKYIFAVVGLLAFAAWAYITRDVADAVRLIGTGSRWDEISIEGQKAYLLEHPIAFIDALARTLLSRDLDLLVGFFGQFSFVFIPVPGISIVLCLLSLIFGMLLIGPRIRFDRRLLAISIILLTGIVSIFGTLYLTFSNVGQNYIEGVQGRYFLPFAPLIFVLLAVLLPKAFASEKNMEVFAGKIKYWIFGCTAISLACAAGRFYYILLG